jgi:hypothetical protein
VHLRVTFDSVAAIQMRPYPQIAIRAYSGETAEERVLLHRGDGKPLEVTGIKVEGEGGFKVTAVPVTEEDVKAAAARSEETPATPSRAPGQPKPEPELGDVWLVAKVTAPAERTSYRATAQVAVEHPDVDEVKVPLTLVVTDLIQAIPAFTRLWLIGDDQPSSAAGRTVTTTLRQVKDRPFEIKGVEVSHPDLFMAKVTSEGAKSVHTVEVKLRDDVEPGKTAASVRGRVKVMTTDPDAPEVDINVLVSQSRTLAQRRPAGQHRGMPRPGQPKPEPPPGPDAPAQEDGGH